MGDESSPEEKLRIASHFILSAPNGEVDDIIADVKTLMGSGSMLSDDVLLKLLKEYNTEQYVFAPLESGNNLPCSKFGASGSKFLDPSTGMTYTFDHVRRNWSDEKSAGSVSIDTPASGHRAAIEKALKKYMESFYVNAKEYATAVYDNRDDTITVVISAKKVNLVNYWSGGWKGTYVINLKKNKFHGHINVNVHYFEEGNVQLNTNIEHEQDIKGADSESCAKATIEAIHAMENKFQKSLEEMYLNMKTETFKAMRRFLPVTRSKMDWNPASHKIAQQIHK